MKTYDLPVFVDEGEKTRAKCALIQGSKTITLSVGIITLYFLGGKDDLIEFKHSVNVAVDGLLYKDKSDAQEGK